MLFRYANNVVQPKLHSIQFRGENTSTTALSTIPPRLTLTTFLQRSIIYGLHGTAVYITPNPVLKSHKRDDSTDYQICSMGLYHSGLSNVGGNFGVGDHGEQALGTQGEHFAQPPSCFSQHAWQGILGTLIFSDFLLLVFQP